MSDKMKQCEQPGISGSILVRAYCKDCQIHHYQWKLPCPDDCEDGKVRNGFFGYKICEICSGNTWVDMK